MSQIRDADYDPEAFGESLRRFRGDPDKVLEEARKLCPVFRDQQNTWVVTTYDEAQAVLNDHDTFSSHLLRLPPVPLEFEDRLPVNVLDYIVLNLDPPAHTRMKRAFARSLTARRVADLEAPLRAAATEIASSLASSGDTSADLIDDFVHPLLSRMRAVLLGLDEDDVMRLDSLVADMASLMILGGRLGPLERAVDPKQIASRFSEVAIHEWYGRLADDWEYMQGYLESRELEPDGGLASAMLGALNEDGEPEFTRDEIIGSICALVVGSIETTANLIGELVVLLDLHPDQRTQVQSDARLIPNAIEEALRYRPAPAAVARRPLRDVEIGGVQINAGDQLVVSLHSAGRDLSQFENPDDFDIHRENARKHLSLGRGVHSCPGQPLLRLNARVALEVLYRELPNLRLSGKPLGIEPLDGRPVLRVVPVRWD